ncbi:NnrU family protein [Kiloniella laminariae]|uniref:NnrU family protein n=1 Tax=Kiloniella laminariae TaxID=454162 RepID=UPI00036FD04C|nr:NnrU family protein [Kiloniella laminariae]
MPWAGWLGQKKQDEDVLGLLSAGAAVILSEIMSDMAFDGAERCVDMQEGAGVPLQIVGLLVFAVLHLATATRSFRSLLVSRLGEGLYKSLFSVLSLLSFAAALYGYARTGFVPYWPNDAAVVLLQSFLIMPLAIILLVSSYVSRGTQRLTRHPMLSGVALACFGHVLVNGDQSAVILFGGLGIYAVIAMVWSDQQRRHSSSEQDQLFLSQTGYLPKISRLKFQPGDTLPRLGVMGPAIGLVAYGLALSYHGQLIGVSPLASLVGG